MPVFSVTGPKAKDLWLVDNQPNFGTFPGGLLTLAPEPLPIWLRVGTNAYGERHILARHEHWIKRSGMTVCELVHKKLGQPGMVYCTEVESKVKVSIRMSPDALLILNLMSVGESPHFSVTSLYIHTAKLDGKPLGRYPGRSVMKKSLAPIKGQGF